MKKKNPIYFINYNEVTSIWEEEVSQILQGGYWRSKPHPTSLRVHDDLEPYDETIYSGFRLCRTTKTRNS